MTFDEIFHEFTKTKYWQDMLLTREDSPYHREENVGIHTRMVLDAYRDMFYSSRTPEQRLLTQIAILFHDVGKPAAMTKKYNETRGHYNSFGGHELTSACGFIDYVCEHDLGLNINQLRVIRWMIENHLPYEKGKAKMMEWRADMTHVLGPYVICFRDLMLSDAKGRITDDNRFQQSVDWTQENLIETLPKSEIHKYSDRHDGLRTAYILVGPSGAGKSTTTDALLINDTIKHFNKDDLRIEWYELMNGEAAPYDIAWQYSVDNESKFNQFITERFTGFVKEGYDVVLDNTNLTTKSRRRWIAILKQHNYHIIGVEFWSSMNFLEKRRVERTDHNVPYSSLRQQFLAQSLLRYGSEIHELSVIKNG